MRIRVLAKAIFAAGIVLSLTACMGVRPAGQKAGKKLYETFYVGEEGTQYFIKSMTFNDIRNGEMELDITFRGNKQKADSAILNISVFGDEVLKAADSLQIANSTSTLVVRELKYMFADRKKDEYHSRFSTKVSLAELSKLFENESWSITLCHDNVKNEYLAKSNTKKKINKINLEVFSLL
jgi:hypothetical protein